MELHSLTCAQCGAAIPYTVGATHLKCEFCGTEYVLKQSSDRASGTVDVEYMGRGPLFRCFVPEGWTVRVTKEEDSESYQATVCRGLRLDSPEGARLLFCPFAYYRSFEPGKLNLHKNYQLDPATGTRFRRRVPLGQYIAERVTELFGQVDGLRVTPAAAAGNRLERRAALFAEDAAKALKRQTAAEQGKFRLEFTSGGAPYSGYMASALVYAKAREQRAASPEPQPQKSGGRGILDKLMNYKGALGGPSLNDISQSLQSGNTREILGSLAAGDGGLAALSGAGSGADWGRGFDFILIAPAGDAPRYESIFDEFCARLEYCPLYYALQDEEAQKIQQIILNGMQQRQQISINASQRLQRTLSETSDIINSGYRQRSATMDSIFRKQSEAVRGVNTYTDNHGLDVEADVRYERVFQRGSDYAGTTSAGAEPGGDWVELKRR